jgi:hypothetical protein
MTRMRDRQGMKDMSARLLEERTGEDLAAWNERIAQEHRMTWMPRCAPGCGRPMTRTAANQRGGKEKNDE